jgi:phosphoserine phosphatase RsbU/P
MELIRNKGLAFKLSVLILGCTLLIFLFLFGYSYTISRKMILKNVRESTVNLAASTVNRLQVFLTSVETISKNMVTTLEIVSSDKQLLAKLIISFVENNEAICGSTVAFEPFAFNKDKSDLGCYVYKTAGKIESCSLGGESYNYFLMDWYQIPKELNSPIWSEPYYHEGGGNAVMATYSVPLYISREGQRRFIGILTADISLSWLQKIVSSIKIYETGYAFLISKNGTCVTHPRRDFIMNESVFSIAEARQDRGLREAGRAMINGRSGFVPFKSMVTEKEGWLAYTPLYSNGWSLGIFIPEEELMADIYQLNRTVLVLGMFGITILLAVIVYLANTITKPLRFLSQTTQHIAKGNLDVELPLIKSGDEIGQLTNSFDHMKRSLKTYVEQLTEATATRERIESELKIAHEIQMGMLPKIFPPFPDETSFDIYAVIEPAKEVGGDFYDFFHVDDHRLCFTIGDVSGKGVPAALFMAITKTLIKVAAGPDIFPDRILDRVNNELAQDNDACMFVTIFLGILDIRTGEIFYANGGHNPPLIISENDSIEFIKQTAGPVVGALEKQYFECGRLMLRQGDSLFLYTDGVTEAMNEHLEFFSEKRLQNGVALLREKHITDLVHGVMQNVTNFSHGMPQSDDITIMVLKFLGER